MMIINILFNNLSYIQYTHLFFIYTSPAIITLSLHDALPISQGCQWEPVERAHGDVVEQQRGCGDRERHRDRKSTRLNSSHVEISYAVFCLKKKIIYF